MNDQQKNLLLPKLIDGHGVEAGNPGEWAIRSFDSYDKVAKSLSIEDDGGDLRRVTAIPNMWGRALSVESALYLDSSKLHNVMVTQWEGMLAAIALSEVYGGSGKLTSELLDLSEDYKDRRKKVADALLDLMPPSFEERALYTLPPEVKRAGTNPWQKIFILFWGGKPIGTTSPSTIVWPSEEGIWDGIPWWNSKEKRFIDPEKKITDKPTRVQLALWLSELHDSFDDSVNSRIKGLVKKFIEKIYDPKPSGALQLSDHRIFGEKIHDFKIIKLLDHPVAILPKKSNVEVISNDRHPDRKLLIVDHDLLRQWGLEKRPEEIWVEGTLNYTQLDALISKVPKTKNRLVTPNDLLLPEDEFFYIEQNNAFIPQGQAESSAWLPVGSEELSIDNPLGSSDEIKITPLLPLKVLFLDYFSPEKLAQITTIQKLPSGKIALTVKLKLSGNTDAGRDYKIYREYKVKKENSTKDVPVLEIWPNFIDPSGKWNLYYLFYGAPRGSETFDINSPSGCKEFTDSELGGKYKIANLNKFPDCIVCKHEEREVGLILPKATEDISREHNETAWTVGVDFGTSFTDIAVYSNTTNQPVQLQLVPLSLKVTGSNYVRTKILDEFFIREENMSFPLATIITTRPNEIPITENTNVIPINTIVDGRIYVPSTAVTSNTEFDPNAPRIGFDPNAPHIGTGLKWTADQKRQRIFLKHLILGVLARAAQQRVGTIQWALSYPTAFRARVETTYQQTWQDLTTGDLGERTTGIKQKQPSEIDQSKSRAYFQTESIALAQYFKCSPQDKKPFRRVVCIDVGGGTSDISIWQDSELQFQCSVRLAGRNLFTHVLKKHPTLLSTHFGVDPNLLAGCDSRENSKVSDDNIDSKLESLMRKYSEDWLNKKAYLSAPEYQEFLLILALGWSGIYYYIGVMLRVLQNEGKFTATGIEAVIDSVYIGGNGSRLLHWLAEDSSFNSDSHINLLLSRMMACGMQLEDFRDFRVTTELSTNPKGEVCFGLVFNEASNLKEPAGINKLPIAGEYYRIEGVNYTTTSSDVGDIAYGRLSQGQLAKFSSNDFNVLPKFLCDFNQSLKDINRSEASLARLLSVDKLLERSSMKYNPDSGVADQNPALWNAVETRLTVHMEQARASQTEEVGSPYILGLKSLIDVISEEWAKKWRK